MLDLEYNADGAIWLIGIHINTCHDVKTLQFWCDNETERRLALTALKNVLCDYAELPIVTWGGESADLPVLLEACRRHDLGELSSALKKRHFDICAFVKRNVRLPIPSNRLKEVAAYYGYTGTTSISNGLEATRLHHEYVRDMNDKRRAQIRDELRAYNRDDLLATAYCLKNLSKSRPN